ncbi:glycosyltransferase family 39 protein [Desulfovibrio sp. JC010]|uniref:ArnT family glycosyltransferase n=1 Tax=Desulfovibrio sp. JC010 TaxID=2593641 RepID=UPI0013D13A23|nr:glycosyltransferase family 39 protein [Desulfovibrio sp. JC010]NDV26101.1 glycosyl transferase [Desulfovibrio sp. JC010]
MDTRPESGLNEFCRKNWPLLLGLLLLFSAVVSCYGTWLNYFYDIDEPKYARAVYEMVHSGNLLAPMFDGMPRMEKPPLTYWVMYPFAWLASLGDFGGNALGLLRLPTIICSVLMVLGTALTGRKLFGPATGLLAGMILQSSVLFKFMAVMMKVDVVFACCVTWATYVYLLRYLGDRGPRTAIGGAVLTALGVLAKGPFAFLPMAGYALAVGLRYNVQRKHEAGESASFLSAFNIKGLVAAKWNDRNILLLWFVAGCVPFFLWLYFAWLSSGFDYTQGLLGQFFHNTASTSSKVANKLSRLDPYFDTLTVIFFPWGGFVFGTVYGIYRSVREKFNEKYVFMACVFLVYLLVFTLLFKLKSNRYMLPVLPLLAVLVCDWLLNAKRDKMYRTLFEMGFVWILSMAAMLGYRSFKSGSVSVNLADRVAVGQYMELMFPFFIALGAFFLVFLVISIKQSQRPALHIVVGSLAISAVMPFYYKALPSYASLTENRPQPVLAQALTDKLAEFSDEKTLVLHRPFFIKTFPDVVYYLKKLAKDGDCMYSLGSEARPGDLLQTLATPDIAAEIFKKEHPDAEKYPLYQYLKNTKFNNAVLLLSSIDYYSLKPFIDSLPPMGRNLMEVEEMDLLTIKWVEGKIYIVRFNPGKMK